ncbi:hypothetical protein J7E97_07855 [Streptomyces sp. ISL-66]|uniref:hypothetical protein n=1 Tax=Streptomyces sp. ISL-66 TaxID=2819186 RepID=UPI001BEA1630|nr:hypothetical protein [Streptomyces sp. ISL-66]MBT2467787.1 hypothetical protein [Streptomyces sp. ISL-66]
MTAMRTETVVMSALLSNLPVVPVPIAGPLLRSLGLTRREAPAWVTDPATRASALDGFIEIPDEFYGEAS